MAEERSAEVAPGNIREHARHEGDLVVRGAVRPEREVVLGSAGDIGEDRPRKAPFSGALEVVERENVGENGDTLL
jgi:hypothetical protein